MIFKNTFIALSAAAAVAVSATAYADDQDHHFPSERHVRHVVLISVDGLHAVDLENYIHRFPSSTLAQLSEHGVRYTSASASKPSDSFPGLLAMVTGGSPLSTGVFYDNSYDRSLFPAGSNCAGAPGTEVVFDESIDNATLDGIDPTKLPLAASLGCKPVYPHSFLNTNTIFEVIRSHGGGTAWADKHPAYDLVNGPSGKGVNDLYTPEITDPNGADATTSVVTTVENDNLKVAAVLNEIRGFDHSGKTRTSVPTILGMNFQAVSVGQKLANDIRLNARGGYLDSAATPTPVLDYGLAKTDASLGLIVQTLKGQGLYDSTLIIVSAKHGQAPIDPAKVNKPGSLAARLSALSSIAKVTEDDVALIWLKDQSQTQNIVDLLRANQASWDIQEILFGESLKLHFNDPKGDTRTSDIVVLPTYGTIFTGSKKKIAEHGGFSDADTNVALLVSQPGVRAKVVKSPVETTQIAPTILEALGINPAELHAVRLEKTASLPALGMREDSDR